VETNGAFAGGTYRATLCQRVEEPNEFQRYLNNWLRFSKSRNLQDKARAELSKVLPQIPCTVSTIATFTASVNPEKEMFDVVIVDEASMLSSPALSLLFLTEQLVVIGDDQQISKLFVGTENDRFKAIATTHLSGLPLADRLAGDDSLFNLIDLLPCRSITLRKHFRCMPEIIQYSNEICYGPLERPLLPLRKVSSDRVNPLKAVMVAGAQIEEKGKTPFNSVEAEWIVEYVKKIIDQDPDGDTSIGIITLLGDWQHKVIQRLLEQRISGKELDKRQIFAGMPPDFQGAERDIILLSLVTAPGHNANPSTKDIFKQRFNVAVSRAKDQLILFCSQPPGALRGELQNKLLSHCQNFHVSDPVTENMVPITDYERRPSEGYSSWFHTDIARTIAAQKFPVYIRQTVGELPLDLVVDRQDNSRLVVICPRVDELDVEEWEDLLQRYLVLVRADWDVRIVDPYLFDLSSSRALEAVFDELGPSPISTGLKITHER
jgi:hypothetical protein